MRWPWAWTMNGQDGIEVDRAAVLAADLEDRAELLARRLGSLSRAAEFRRLTNAG